MSMIGNFRMATDELIERLLAQPGEIERVLYPDGDGAIDPGAEIDVDKAWHGIHFLLCAHPWEGAPPLNFVVSGGAPVGDVDVGYGPARVFTSAQVAEIVRALEPITTTDLKGRFNAAAFTENEIYPGIWDEPETECVDDYVLHYFEALKHFLKKARDQHRGLIVYLN